MRRSPRQLELDIRTWGGRRRGAEQSRRRGASLPARSARSTPSRACDVAGATGLAVVARSFETPSSTSSTTGANTSGAPEASTAARRHGGSMGGVWLWGARGGDAGRSSPDVARPHRVAALRTHRPPRDAAIVALIGDVRGWARAGYFTRSATRVDHDAGVPIRGRLREHRQRRPGLRRADGLSASCRVVTHRGPPFRDHTRHRDHRPCGVPTVIPPLFLAPPGSKFTPRPRARARRFARHQRLAPACGASPVGARAAR
jgi:hypothetical protein